MRIEFERDCRDNFGDMIYRVIVNRATRAGSIIRDRDQSWWNWINWNRPGICGPEVTCFDSLRDARRRAAEDVREDMR